MTQDKKASPSSEIELPDPIALSQAMINAYKKAEPLWEDFIQNHSADFLNQPLDPLNMRETIISYWDRVADNPEYFWESQINFWHDYALLWQSSMQKFLGETEDTAAQPIKPEKGDRRFKADEWDDSAVFDFIKQSYLLFCQHMDKSIADVQGMKPHEKEKLKFANRLFTSALSPTNFLLTNPEVLKETIQSGGKNLVKGLENLIEDLKRGHGELSIRTTDYDAFKLGENIATTPGKVVYENDLIQLIQYEATTKEVYRRPLLIIPPWINKYYILDLRPENSFVKWATEQGHTVFIVSWVNPDAKLAKKSFEDYMKEGILDSLDQIKKITGEPDCNVIGYCLGGTLLSIALSYLQKKKQEKRIASATFLTTLIDFEESGEMKLFMDDAQLEMMEKDMKAHGVLQGKQLKQTFSLLRANDLIWSFVVNNYLMGKEPFPFDLLYWNDDSTNMPAAMHSFYLRNMYRDNKLTEPGGITIGGVKIDVSKVKTPAYFLSTREDHIAPWQATYAGARLIGSDNKSFTLAASGHIAGVVNPPEKNKYCFWTYDRLPEKPSDWIDKAKQKDGSWWPHWQNWIKNKSGGKAGDKVKARTIKNAIESAPGRYVLKK